MNADLSTIFTVLIIIFALFGGVIEKLLKNKQAPPPPRHIPNIDPADEAGMPDESAPAPLGELIRNLRRMQGLPPESPDGTISMPEVQPIETLETLETIPVAPEQNVSHRLNAPTQTIPTHTPLKELEPEEFVPVEFEIRQAIIASEILNRKYA